MEPYDLSEDDLGQIREYLKSPLGYPDEFKTWLKDWLGLNLPAIPVSQLLGYQNTRAHYAVVTTRDNETTPDSTWTDLTTYGPEITGLADGTYWAAWGFHAPGEHAGGSQQDMGLSVNGANPVNTCHSSTVDSGKTVWRADVLTVKNGLDNNTITAKYFFGLTGGAEAQYQRRWMIVMRIT